MRSIIGLPSETAATIRAGWQWIDDQIGVNGLPEEILIPFRLCYQSAVCEMICRHYIEGLTQDAFLRSFDDRHIEEMVAAIFESDEDRSLNDWFMDMVEEWACESTPFWAVVLTNYLRHSASIELAVDVDPEASRRERRWRHEMVNMAMSIAHGIGFMITSTMESFDYLSQLPRLPRHLDVDNVEVDLKTKRIVIWELKNVNRV